MPTLLAEVTPFDQAVGFFTQAISFGFTCLTKAFEFAIANPIMLLLLGASIATGLLFKVKGII